MFLTDTEYILFKNIKYFLQVTFFRSEYLTQEEAFKHPDGVVMICYLIKVSIDIYYCESHVTTQELVGVYAHKYNGQQVYVLEIFIILMKWWKCLNIATAVLIYLNHGINRA